MPGDGLLQHEAQEGPHIAGVSRQEAEGASYKNRQIGCEGCLGGFSGPELGYQWVFHSIPWPFQAGKRPERAKITTQKLIGDHISSQKAPQNTP